VLTPHSTSRKFRFPGLRASSSSLNGGRRIADLDIYRAAKLLVHQHGTRWDVRSVSWNIGIGERG
jgi:hypothetical protein